MLDSNNLFFFHNLFDNFDEFNHLSRAWDADFRQIERGKFSAELLQLGTESALVTYASFNRRLDQRGTPPADVWTFAFPTRESTSFIWKGQEVNKNTILVYQPGDGIDCVSTEGFNITTVSLARETLDRMCQSLELPDIKVLLDNQDRVYCERSAMNGIHKQAQEIYHFLKQDPNHAGSVALHDELEAELPHRLLFALANKPPALKINRVRSESRVLSNSLEFIEASDQEPIKIKNLCRALQISERTLQDVFQKRYGVSPKFYINALRLNRVYKELRRASTGEESIISVANRRGFWHMGQFAADYRKFFGELPSETLRSSL